MSSDSSDEDALVLYYYLRVKRRKLMRKRAKHRKLLMFNKSSLENEDLFKTLQVDSNINLKCDEVKIEQEDPLTLPGPSYECDGVANIKLELEKEDTKLVFEESETRVGFYKTEVKMEPVDDNEGTRSENENVTDKSDNEDIGTELVPRVLVAVKRKGSSTNNSRAKRRR